jgi:hypothetical protein
MPLDGWTVVCQIGLWGWIVSAIALIVRAFPSRGVLNRKSALRWGTVLTAFYVVWIAGMVLS